MPPRTHHVSVKLAANSYDIIVEAGVLQRTGEHLRQLSASKQAVVMSDSNVAPNYLGVLQSSLRTAGFEVAEARLPRGEQGKTLEDLLPVYDQLLAAKIERSTPILSLGGGVVCDMAGFVAATLLRGVPMVQIPTSLLAMVDASIGGKTGVNHAVRENHAVGKNLIGAFHQPIAVFIDPQVLLTLPEKELRGGLAECIKHDLIHDADGFGHLEKNIERALKLDVDYLGELVAHNVAIKARVVEKDPFERGERAHLNFGHTFGHAIETASKYFHTHGESVGLGMAAAAFTSRELGMIDEGSRRRIVAVIERAGLPTHGPHADTEEIFAAMAFDKKVRAGKLRFILLNGIGRAVVRDDVPAELVRKAIASLR